MALIFIVGPDGLGKTTVAKRISKILDKPYVKMPYGSDGDTETPVYSGQIIRKILNDKENPCDPAAFQALQYVNKMEAAPIVKNLEEAHKIVIVDRGTLCQLIYGKADGLDEAWNEMLYAAANRLLYPTLIFVFRGQSFKRDNDIYGEKQEKVRALYNEYCEEHDRDVRVVPIDIDGKSLDTVTLEVLTHIVQRFYVPATVGGKAYLKEIFGMD